MFADDDEDSADLVADEHYAYWGPNAHLFSDSHGKSHQQRRNEYLRKLEEEKRKKSRPSVLSYFVPSVPSMLSVNFGRHVSATYEYPKQPPPAVIEDGDDSSDEEVVDAIYGTRSRIDYTRNPIQVPESPEISCPEVSFHHPQPRSAMSHNKSSSSSSYYSFGSGSSGERSDEDRRRARRKLQAEEAREREIKHRQEMKDTWNSTQRRNRERLRAQGLEVGEGITRRDSGSRPPFRQHFSETLSPPTVPYDLHLMSSTHVDHSAKPRLPISTSPTPVPMGRTSMASSTATITPRRKMKREFTLSDYPHLHHRFGITTDQTKNSSTTAPMDIYGSKRR